MVGNLELLVDLVLLNMENLDIILGMDWLVAYHAMVHLYSEEVVFHILGLVEFSFQGVKKDSFPFKLGSFFTKVGKVI